MDNMPQKFVLIIHGALVGKPCKVYDNGNEEHAMITQTDTHNLTYKSINFYTYSGVILEDAKNDTNTLHDNICSGLYKITETKTGVKETDMTTKNADDYLLERMIFGVKSEDKNDGKSNVLGLYHCNNVATLLNYEDIAKQHPTGFNYETLFSYINKYCENQKISTRDIELHLFSCRGFRPLPSYKNDPKNPNKRPRDENAFIVRKDKRDKQPIKKSGGSNDGDNILLDIQRIDPATLLKQIEEMPCVPMDGDSSSRTKQTRGGRRRKSKTRTKRKKNTRKKKTRIRKKRT